MATSPLTAILSLLIQIEITQVHGVIEFNQSPWLKPYIDHNTEIRRNATYKFDENQAKLMNNSFLARPVRIRESIKMGES